MSDELKECGVTRALLSPREQEVARLVAERLSDDEIANILTISVRTVQTYLDRIGKKLDAAKDASARRRVIREWVLKHAA